MFGRRWGKNVLGIDEAMTAALKGKRVGWFEPTYKSLHEVWDELVSRLRAVSRDVSEQSKRMELVTGGVIEMWTCDIADPARGRSYDLVIINECGVIRNLTSIWQAAIRPTLTDRAGKALFMGTPKGASHDFSVLHRKAEAPLWERFHGPTSENPFIDQNEIASAKAELPADVFAQEYEGIPSEDGGNPFGLQHIKACTVTDRAEIEKLFKLTPTAAGWDFARSHDWTVGIALTDKYEVCRFNRWKGVPWGEQKARIRQVNGATPAWGDATRSRVDDVIVQDLQRLGVPMIPVPFSFTMRQALMQRLQVCIHQHKLKIPDGPITQELQAFGYVYTSRGVTYRAPDNEHDDCVMALALAVFGRDQFGERPELVTAPLYDQDKHPGFETASAKRKKPWEAGWQPDTLVESWLPNEADVEPLKW